MTNIVKEEKKVNGFEHLTKQEAASLVASRNVKIFMKLEDPTETYDLFEKSVAEIKEKDNNK